jgi:hypothetical protein
MTTFVYNKDFPTGYRLFTKGQGEKSTSFCNSYLDPKTGKEEKIDEKVLENRRNF